MSTLSKRTIRVPAVVAAVLSAGLLLGACGGEDGGGGKSSDAIEGAGKGAGGDKSASSSASPSKEKGAPSFDLPDDVTVKIEGAKVGDDGRGALTRDAVYSIKALVEARANGTPGTANMVRYFKSPALPYWGKVISDAKKQGTKVTGKFVYYNFRVGGADPKGTDVRYCEDQRYAYAKEIKSGKVRKTKPSEKSFSEYHLGMVKGKKGDWKVTQGNWKRGVKSCVRD